MLDWLQNVDLRRRVHAASSKGGAGAGKLYLRTVLETR